MGRCNVKYVLFLGFVAVLNTVNGVDVDFSYDKTCYSYGDNMELTAVYTGNGTVTAVEWYYSGNIDSKLIVIACTCSLFGAIDTGYPATTRMAFSCFPTTKTFTLTLVDLMSYELDISWGATFSLFAGLSPPVVRKSITICDYGQYESTTDVIGISTTLVPAMIVGIHIKGQNEPVKGGEIQIVCEIVHFSNAYTVMIYKTESIPTSDLTTAPPLVSCTSTKCTGTEPRHTFSSSYSGVTITITNLNRLEDQKYWTCFMNNDRLYTYLTVYTITPTLRYDNPPDQGQDLAENSVIFKCDTGCAYPSPNFIWYYKKTDGSRHEWSKTAPVTEKTGDCTDSEKIYTSTLNLSRYTLFTDNTDTTVKFQCGATSVIGTTYQRFTQTSVDVRFAVQVSSVTLKDGSSTVSRQLQVVSDVSKTLTCETSVSRPAATIIWYIGTQEKQRSTSSTFRLTPKTCDQSKQIYCKAFNKQPEREAVTSYNSTLLVKASDSRSETCTYNTETSYTLPIILGVVCAVLFVYATGLTIMYKRNIQKKGTRSNLENGFSTNDNMGITVVQHYENEASAIDEEPSRQYTELSHFSNERSPYDLLHQ